jgi:hypothetical protein
MNAKLQIHANLNEACIALLKGKLEQFDTGNLEYFRLYDRTHQTRTKGLWGRCTYPNPKKNLGYRIRCCVSILPSKWPYRARLAIGTKQMVGAQWKWVWKNDCFHSQEEAFVWLAGHEAFHWLRHSRQIPGANYETQANRYGFTWLEEWRAMNPVNEPAQPKSLSSRMISPIDLGIRLLRLF